MPKYDGTGPRGEGMFTGRGEGYCALRLPQPDSDEPAVGYAGIAGRPTRLVTGQQQPLASADAAAKPRLPCHSRASGRRCRCGRRRYASQQLAANRAA
jgi:hypothetical protein